MSWKDPNLDDPRNALECSKIIRKFNDQNEISSLRTALIKAREALAFYARGSHEKYIEHRMFLGDGEYITKDRVIEDGTKAREALKQIDEVMKEGGECQE